MEIHLSHSGLVFDSANLVTTHARFHHKGGIEGSISLTYPPGEASEVQEILSTLQETNKITVLSYFTQPVAQHLGPPAAGFFTTKGEQ